MMFEKFDTKPGAIKIQCANEPRSLLPVFCNVNFHGVGKFETEQVGNKTQQKNRTIITGGAS